jgi:hypothetical protein
MVEEGGKKSFTYLHRYSKIWAKGGKEWLKNRYFFKKE